MWPYLVFFFVVGFLFLVGCSWRYYECVGFNFLRKQFFSVVAFGCVITRLVGLALTGL